MAASVRIVAVKALGRFNTLVTNSKEIIADTKGVISIFKSKTVHLHTTRSWDFLGLSMDYSTEKATPMWQQAYGGDVIVGVFDTGGP